VQSCPACGQENLDVARFCLACGRQLAAEEASRREERRLVTVIFVDLVGFTSRAEVLDPEDVRAILSPYHDAVRTEIESFGGIVEKFIGDAVMGIFGAPTAFGDDAERAVRAAFAVRDAVSGVRIAVNTGEALVTLDAHPERGEAMIAGDVVNTAARLQAAAPENGIVVGEETYRATRDIVDYEPAEPVKAKGKAEAVRAWFPVRMAAPAGERDLSGVLVGRTRELATLTDIWRRATEERTPHLVTILGDAGLGKTRLAVEFGHIVDELGGSTVRGRSLPYRDSGAYGAFSAQLKQLCHVFESDSPETALAKLRDTVAALLESSNAEDVTSHLSILMGLDPHSSVADRETLFFSVRCFIEAVARDRPMVLVFEDLHWADASLLDLVELLAQRLRDLPILILALARPELLDERPAWGGGLPAHVSLPLAPLSAHESQELAQQRLASFADDKRIAALTETAAGNPLFIEQLAATLAETAGAPGPLPATIKGLLAARLDALPAAERALLLDAAVVGKVFWRGALVRMSKNDEALSDLLGALERRDLIRRETVSAIEGDQQFTFTHVLIRDVAYDLIPRAQRRERHAEVASYFEQATSLVGEAAAALGRHWRDAGDHQRALGYFTAAAEQAEKGWAKGLAVTLYREALELVDEEDDATRSALRRRLAIVQQAQFHVEDVRLLRRGD
jgi:class 3 adenylate cyclase